jgi:hypothetical protein
VVRASAVQTPSVVFGDKMYSTFGDKTHLPRFGVSGSQTIAIMTLTTRPS